jgi:hypothetical protein
MIRFITYVVFFGVAIGVCLYYLYQAEQMRKINQRTPASRPFCKNCPDHEACLLGAPCDLVKKVNGDWERYHRPAPYDIMEDK